MLGIENHMGPNKKWQRVLYVHNNIYDFLNAFAKTSNKYDNIPFYYITQYTKYAKAILAVSYFY